VGPASMRPQPTGPKHISHVEEFLQSWTPNYHPELYGYSSTGELIASFDGFAVSNGTAGFGTHDQEPLNLLNFGDDALKKKFSWEFRNFNTTAVKQIWNEMKMRRIMPNLKTCQEMLIVACKGNNPTLAMDFFTQMLTFDLLPSQQALKTMRLLLGPNEFSKLIVNAEVSSEMKSKWEEVLSEIAVDLKSPKLLPDGDEFGKLQLDLLRMRPEHLEINLERLTKANLGASQLASIWDLPWSGKTMAFPIVEMLLKMTVENPDALSHHIKRKGAIGKLQAAGHNQTRQGFIIPDSFFEGLQALSIPTKPFTDATFEKILSEDLGQAKEFQMRYNDDLNDEQSVHRFFIACAERGSVAEFSNCLNEMMTAHMQLDRPLVRRVMKAIRDSETENNKERNLKRYMLSQNHRDLLQSSDWLPFPRNIELTEISAALNDLLRFRMLDNDVVLAALDWALRDGQESLIHVLNFFASSNIAVEDEAILTKVMAYFADLGNSDVALEVFQKLIGTDQRPTLEMFKILLRLFVSQSNLDLAQYILDTMESMDLSFDQQSQDLILRLKALQGNKDEVHKLKRHLENTPNFNLNIDSYNALLSYTWEDEGKYMESLINEMAERGIERNVESYTKILEACNRPNFPNLSSWVLDQMEKENIDPTPDIARYYLQLCDANSLQPGFDRLISLNAEFDGKIFETIAARVDTSEDSDKFEILFKCLRNMGEHTDEKYFLRVVDLVSYDLPTFWKIIDIMREKAVVPTEDSLSTLFHIYQTSIQQREVTEVLDAIFQLETQGLFLMDANIISLCSGVGIPDPDAEYLHQKLRERKKEKRKRRLESQTSLRQQLNLS